MLSQDDDSPDHQRFWVMTTRVEQKRIAARIRQPNGITQNTNNGTSFDSYVHLRGIPQVIYTTSNIRVTRVVLESGTYDSRIGQPQVRHQESWDQVNYFVTTDVHPLARVDSYGYSSTGITNTQNDRILAFSYIYFARQFTTLMLHYIWPMGLQRDSSVGLLRQSSSTANPQYTVRAYAVVRTRQQDRTALCLTRMSFRNRHQI